MGLSNTVKDLILIIKTKSLKEIFLGNKVELNEEDTKLLGWVRKNPEEFVKIGGRQGEFVKRDIIHKGFGKVYLLPKGEKSLLLFDSNVKIQPGPDLWVYLQTGENAEGEILDLGLLKGTKGGQAYLVDKKIDDLKKYKSAVIYCKKFKILFTYANLK